GQVPRPARPCSRFDGRHLRRRGRCHQLEDQLPADADAEDRALPAEARQGDLIRADWTSELGLAILGSSTTCKWRRILPRASSCSITGRVFAEGAPEAICRDPRVTHAYLGADDIAGAPSEPSKLTIK